MKKRRNMVETGTKIKESLCGICHCLIKDSTLFTTLAESELECLKNAVSTIAYVKKETVFFESDECKGLYVVRVGRVKLVRTSKDGKEQIIRILEPGDLLGLEFFHDAANYTSTAVAMEPTELCFIGKKDFFVVLDEEPTISRKILAAMGKELAHAYDRIGNLGLLNASQKLANLLYTLAGEYGVKCEDGGVKLHLTLSRLEIAGLLGITHETSIRLLKGFREDGVLEIKKREIVIRSMERLAELGGVE